MRGGRFTIAFSRFVKWKFFPIALLLMIVFGSWLNAQGAWVKDFAQYDVVNLPLLFITLRTTGLQWYTVGLTDDIGGLMLNVVGIYLLRYYSKSSFIGLIKRPYFVVTIAAYMAFDFLSFYFYLLYTYGHVSITAYGYVWNDSEYFVMLPMLVLTDVLVFAYRREQA